MINNSIGGFSYVIGCFAIFILPFTVHKLGVNLYGYYWTIEKVNRELKWKKLLNGYRNTKK